MMMKNFGTVGAPRRGDRGSRYLGGQGLTEYVLIVALIAIAAIIVISSFGGTLRAQFAGAATELSGESAQDMIDQAGEYAGCARVDAANRKAGMAQYANEYGEDCTIVGGIDLGD